MKTTKILLICVALAIVHFLSEDIAGQAGKESQPFVAVEQDGRLLPEKQGEVRLRRAPFTLIVRMSPTTVATAYLSTTPEGYDLARSKGSLDPIFPRGGGFAAGDRNDARTVYLSDAVQPS